MKALEDLSARWKIVARTLIEQVSTDLHETFAYELEASAGDVNDFMGVLAASIRSNHPKFICAEIDASAHGSFDLTLRSLAYRLLALLPPDQGAETHWLTTKDASIAESHLVSSPWGPLSEALLDRLLVW